MALGAAIGINAVFFLALWPLLTTNLVVADVTLLQILVDALGAPALVVILVAGIINTAITFWFILKALELISNRSRLKPPVS